MKIKNTTFPKNSELDKSYDYYDSFEGLFIDKQDNKTIEEVGKSFFSFTPKWIESLMSFRDFFAIKVGLQTLNKNNDPSKELEKFNCKIGDKLGFFKVFQKTDTELIMGADESHLNFRVSFLVENLKSENTNKNLIVTTTVYYNNWFGKLYFFPVNPFHKLIIKVMIRNMIKTLER